MSSRSSLRVTMVLLAALLVTVPAHAQDLLIFAAASLKNALDDADALYEKQAGDRIIVSYAASSALARQIEAGAPADVFISADLDWMDELAQKQLIVPATRSDLLGNQIVLVAPAASGIAVAIAPGFPLAAALGDGRLALAEPSAVPAGKYAKAALERLGVWDSLASRIAPAENVRAALLLVARGEAPLGIVYRTDAAAEPGVRIVAEFPPDTHPPIVYPVAVTAGSKHSEAARAYLAFLRSAAARPALERQGFAVLE